MGGKGRRVWIKCPKCKREFESPGLKGGWVSCPHCRRNFYASHTGKPTAEKEKG